MDTVFVEGVGVVLSGIIVFCGSVFLLIAMITGARIAYFITATVTLAFCVMMGLVWSGYTLPFVPPTVNPLGPVGQLPSWSEVGVAEDAGDIDFEQAGSYPEGDWFVPDKEDALESAQASGLKNEAADGLEAAIQEGGIKGYADAGEALINEDSIRLLKVGEDVFGAAGFEPGPSADGTAPDTVFFIGEYDPGTPLRPARFMTLGFFVAFLLHLFGLFFIERKARRETEEREAGRA